VSFPNEIVSVDVSLQIKVPPNIFDERITKECTTTAVSRTIRGHYLGNTQSVDVQIIRLMF
jgi:hypothetical protein